MTVAIDVIDSMNVAVESGKPVSRDVALEILCTPSSRVPELLGAATRMRQRFFGNKINVCSILNAKSGACSEDCAFCAQSSSHETGVGVYPLKSAQEIGEAYRDASDLPIDHFGVVTSGPDLNPEEISDICRGIADGKGTKVSWCASLGSIDHEDYKKLKEAGLQRFHHNLETAESFFSEVCTTHSYADRLQAIRDAKSAGLEVCCGGILGMGETNEQRVEFAAALREESIDSIPINFLVPVSGTKLADVEPIRPIEMLKCIVMFRMMNPSSEIKVCAGRIHLGDLQSMIFYAGATGMMIGPLLTIAGRDVESDLRMIRDLEMEYEIEPVRKGVFGQRFKV